MPETIAPCPDTTLATQAAAGDRAAFAALLNRHYDSLYRMAYRLCGHQQEAEDLTQDICIQLGQCIGQYRGEARFTTWLYRLVVNRAKDRWRQQKRRHTQPLYDDLILADPVASPEQQAIDRDNLRQVTLLPEKLRLAVILVHWHGLNHAEAAKILKISEGTLSWRLHEARRRLRPSPAKGSDKL